MSPLGSSTNAGIPARSASSIRTTASPVLPDPVIPTTTPCVVRSLEPRTTSSVPGSPVFGSITRPRWNDPRSAIAAQSRVVRVLDGLRVKPGAGARIAERDPGDRLGIEKQDGEKRLQHVVARIDELQYRLYAEDRHSVLLVLQGLDASGKDGVIRRAFHGVNPTGVSVTSFKVPVGVELQHDYLWRVHAALPRRGTIGVFNRSHYEDVVAVRMHELAPPDVWRRRYEHIRGFERMLADEGTTVLKVFLNVSRDEQRARFQERIDDPGKRWKFRRDDLKVREHFDDWVAAWDDALTETSTDWAPWYVVPADRNWLKALAVAELVVDALERLGPRLPEPEDGLDGLVV